MGRKKELKLQYKRMKPKMGIFIVQSKINNKSYIEATGDLKKMNRVKFQLEYGNYPNKELQREWNEYGGGNFIIKILENLPYDKDEAKIDYKDELALLEMIWEERLAKEKIPLYEK